MRLSSFAIGVVSAVGLAQGALAADLPSKAPAPPAPAVFNWTGFYIGGFAGGAWQGGRTTTTDPCFVGSTCTFLGNYNGVPPVSYKLASSVIGGGTIGYNFYQSSSFPVVLGVELEGGYLRLNGGAVMNPTGLNDTFASTTVGNWYIAYTGRLGVAFNNWLVYGKAGGVTSKVKSSVIDSNPTGATLNASTDKTETNLAVGGGVEYAFLRNWTIKGEYLFLNLTNHLTFCGAVNNNAAIIDCSRTTMGSGVHTAKLGLNYRFGL